MNGVVKTDLPEISFIVIEYYSLESVFNFLKSISRSCCENNYEIIVSSNSCYPAHTRDKLTIEYPQIIWSFNSRNGGFAYGMNRGMEKAMGKFLVISNPDVQIISGLQDLITFMADHSEIGTAGPKIVDKNGEIQDACRPYVNLPRFITRQIRRIILNTEIEYDKSFDYNLVQTVDWIIGAFMVINRSAYEDTKGFDEDYFMYAEDLDLCTRIRQNGFEIVYFPKTVVEYKGSRSARKINKYTSIFVKSHIRYWNKYGFFNGYPNRTSIVYTVGAHS